MLKYCHFKNFMSRSIKKGPYVDENLMKKIAGKKPEDTGTILIAKSTQI